MTTRSPPWKATTSSPMGPVAITFGIASAAVVLTAALCRSRHATIAAFVLFCAWGATKVFQFDRWSAERTILDALTAMSCALTGVYLMHRRPRLLSPWVLTSSMMLSGLLVALWEAGRSMGFDTPTFPYALARNVLYLIALLGVLSLGLRDGAVHLRTWLCDHPRYRPWSRPGARWGRETETTRRRR